MLSLLVLSLMLIRTTPAFLTSSGVRPSEAFSALTLLESAVPKNAPVTLLESALTKSLALKPFRIRTYKKRRGEGASC